jgi:hypothetical protein
MAGVLSTARRPFDDLQSENNTKKHRTESDDADEMRSISRDLFGVDISPADLEKVGELPRAARMALTMLAGGKHDFDDPVFRAKVDRYMDEFRGRDDAPFVADAGILAAIKALHEENAGSGAALSFTSDEDEQLYRQYNELRTEKEHNVRSCDVRKYVKINGKTPNDIDRRVKCLRTTLNRLGARHGQGNVGEEAFKPRYATKNRSVSPNPIL